MMWILSYSEEQGVHLIKILKLKQSDTAIILKNNCSIFQNIRLTNIRWRWMLHMKHLFIAYHSLKTTTFSELSVYHRMIICREIGEIFDWFQCSLFRETCEKYVYIYLRLRNVGDVYLSGFNSSGIVKSHTLEFIVIQDRIVNDLFEIYNCIIMYRHYCCTT